MDTYLKHHIIFEYIFISGLIYFILISSFNHHQFIYFITPKPIMIKCFYSSHRRGTLKTSLDCCWVWHTSDSSRWHTYTCLPRMALYRPLSHWRPLVASSAAPDVQPIRHKCENTPIIIHHICYQIDPMVSNECSNVKHKSYITTSVDGSIWTIMLSAQLTITKKSMWRWGLIAAIMESCRQCGGSHTD